MTEQTISEYIKAQKNEIYEYLDTNMFYTARLVLDETIEEYERRIKNGEY